MALGTGTHFEGALLGSDRALGGLCEEVPIFVQTLRNRGAAFYDFMDVQDYIAGSNWLLTTLTSGTATVVSVTGTPGVLRLAATVDAQGIGSFQNLVSSYAPSESDTSEGLLSRIIVAGARFTHTDFSSANWFFGLAPIDTTLMAATGDLLATGGDNLVGFHHIVDATAQGGITGPDGNDVRLVSTGTALANYTATLASAAQVPIAVPANAAVDGVQREYGIRIIGTQSAEWYINGKLVHRRRLSAALTGNLTLSFAMVADGTLNNMDIDYVWGSVTR